MEFFVLIVSIALMVIGAFGIIFLKKPLDKVIMFSILDAGFVLAIVLFKYLDVAMFAALIGPLSTVVFILAIVKINEIRKNKSEFDDTVYVDFEMLKVPAPGGWHSILTRLYGDYMEPFKGTSKHGIILFDPQISYKDTPMMH